MKKFLRKLFGWAKHEGRELRNFMNNYGKQAVILVNVLKILVNSRAVDSLVKKTKTELDDIALMLLKNAISLFSGKASPADEQSAEYIADFVLHLREQTLEQKAAAFFKLASLIIRQLAENEKQEISPSDADTVAQLSYKAVTDSHII